MLISKTQAFNRKFKKLSLNQQEDFYKAIRLFMVNCYHPSLKTHKLKGRWRDFWAFSINHSDRCMFIFLSEEEVMLYNIGSHKIYGE